MYQWLHTWGDLQWIFLASSIIKQEETENEKHLNINVKWHF